jgi:hypothetical protein
MAISKTLSTIRKETNRTGADFLRIDSHVGLTFSGLALAATDEEGRRRTTGIARRAHDTIIRLRQNIELTDNQTTELDRNLLRLKLELQTLGEVF